MLPEWKSEPPEWLTREHWSPLALQDYGDEPFYVNAENPLCLVSANLAFRREVFSRIGPFAPELQRVKDGIGSMEDLELLTRYWRAGGESLYLPSLDRDYRSPCCSNDQGVSPKVASRAWPLLRAHALARI